MTKNRTLICSVVALTSGLVGAYIGGQINTALHNHKCQNQPWGLTAIMCKVGKPGAGWEGATNGIWLGSMLGAFVAGSLTHTES